MKKKLLFLTALSMSIAGLYLFINRPSGSAFAHEGTIQPNLHQLFVDESTKAEYMAWLTKEETRIWKMLGSYGLTKKAFTKMVEEKIFEPVEDESQFFKPKTVALIHSVMEEFGLDPKKISIERFKDNRGKTIAVAGTTSIKIDEEFMEQFTVAGGMKTIGHELQHVKFKDGFLLSTIKKYLPEEGRDQKNHPYNQVSRFIEVRADLLTILQSQVYAQGFTEFYEEYLEKIGQNPGITHPLTTERIALGKNILSNSFYTINI
jgi:hypothetical protein